MQETSALYKSIISGEHWFETAVYINDIMYTDDDIKSLSVSNSVFSGNPGVGGAISAEIDLVIRKPSATIPTAAEVRPVVRVCRVGAQSEWIPKGTFYIDTRDETKTPAGEILTIHGYDAMILAEADYNTTLSLPANDKAVVQDIASKLGITVESFTLSILGSYSISPAAFSMRKILQYVAASYCGNFIITDAGKLRFVPLFGLAAETHYLVTESGDSITFGGDKILV